MASLYIKDDITTQKVRRMARRLGTTQTEAVRRGMEALERELPPAGPAKQDFLEWLDQHRRENPLPPSTGLKADKAFFDRLWGEPD